MKLKVCMSILPLNIIYLQIILVIIKKKKKKQQIPPPLIPRMRLVGVEGV